MNEIIMQYVRDYGSTALMSFLAMFAGCLPTGCATRVTSIGEVSERPVLVLDLPGMSLKVHTIAATFEHDVPVPAPDPVPVP